MNAFCRRHFLKFVWIFAGLCFAFAGLLGYEVIGVWHQPGQRVVHSVAAAKAGDLGGQRKFGEIVRWTSLDQQAHSRLSLRYGARKLFGLTSDNSGVTPLCGVREGAFVAYWDCGAVDVEMCLSRDSDGPSNLNWSRVERKGKPRFDEVIDLETWLERSGWGGGDSPCRALWRRCFSRASSWR
ncbi:MAG: hypothetical protein RL095_931 [Verrucomicrobiota bacterium]